MITSLRTTIISLILLNANVLAAPITYTISGMAEESPNGFPVISPFSPAAYTVTVVIDDATPSSNPIPDLFVYEATTNASGQLQIGGGNFPAPGGPLPGATGYDLVRVSVNLEFIAQGPTESPFSGSALPTTLLAVGLDTNPDLSLSNSLRFSTLKILRRRTLASWLEASMGIPRNSETARRNQRSHWTSHQT